MNILLVEDNHMLREEMVMFLERPDWHVCGVDCAEAMELAMQQRSYHMVVLDLNLPGEDGLSIARRLRDTQPGLGIIMLTARLSQSDRALGYGTGADVYLTKPANVGELESVIENLSMRLRHQAPDMLLCASEQTLTGKNGRSLQLSLKEYRILARLARAPRRELDIAALLQVLGENEQTDPDARRRLAVMLSRLRTKLSSTFGQSGMIKSVRGKGYWLSLPLQLKD